MTTLTCRRCDCELSADEPSAALARLADHNDTHAGRPTDETGAVRGTDAPLRETHGHGRLGDARGGAGRPARPANQGEEPEMSEIRELHGVQVGLWGYRGGVARPVTDQAEAEAALLALGLAPEAEDAGLGVWLVTLPADDAARLVFSGELILEQPESGWRLVAEWPDAAESPWPGEDGDVQSPWLDEADDQPTGPTEGESPAGW
jgi:hypothetical protein